VAGPGYDHGGELEGDQQDHGNSPHLLGTLHRVAGTLLAAILIRWLN
jgi:hypothetical protein